MQTMRQIVSYILYGMLGGAADVVPGISGGTVYYLCGIYDELLTHISSLPSTCLQAYKKKSLIYLFTSSHALFLLSLGSGVMVSFLSLASLIAFLIHHPHFRSKLFALFFGLVFGSFLLLFEQTLITSRHKAFCRLKKCLQLFLFFFGVLFGYNIEGVVQTAYRYSAGNTSSEKATYELILPDSIVVQYDLTKNADNYLASEKKLYNLHKGDIEALMQKKYIFATSCVYNTQTKSRSKVADIIASCNGAIFSQWKISFIYIFSGSIACIAMLLPGISGSFVLHVMGMYGPILSQLLTFISTYRESQTVDYFALSLLLQVGIGVILGGVLFSLFFQNLMRRYPFETNFFLSGCLLGSMWVLWPFQSIGQHLNPYLLERGYELCNIHAKAFSLNIFITSSETYIMIGACLFIIGIEWYALRKKTIEEKKKNKEREKICLIK